MSLIVYDFINNTVTPFGTIEGVASHIGVKKNEVKIHYKNRKIKLTNSYLVCCSEDVDYDSTNELLMSSGFNKKKIIKAKKEVDGKIIYQKIYASVLDASKDLNIGYSRLTTNVNESIHNVFVIDGVFVTVELLTYEKSTSYPFSFITKNIKKQKDKTIPIGMIGMIPDKYNFNKKPKRRPPGGLRQPVIVFDASTEERLVFSSLKAASKHIGYSTSHCSKILIDKGDKLVLNDCYAFRNGKSKWATYRDFNDRYLKRSKANPYKVKVVRPLTHVVSNFKSYREASKFIGVSESTLGRKLNRHGKMECVNDEGHWLLVTKHLGE